MSPALQAFGEVDFNWVRPLDSIWDDAAATSGGPNDDLVEQTLARLLKDTRQPAARPQGAVLVGPSGIGKTHLVGALRRRAWQRGAWFVLLDVLGLTDFWKSAALSFLTSLLQEMPDGRRQVEAVLAGVARQFNVEAQVEAAFNTPNVEPRHIVDLLVGGLAKKDPVNTLKHQDVFRALGLLRSNDLATMGLAHSWLQGYEADEQARKVLGFVSPPPAPVDLVRGMSWIMSLAGPTIVAVDQIDGVVNPSSLAGPGGDDLDAPRSLAEVLAAGLLQLHDVRWRGMTVITCLDDSWSMLKARGLASFVQRFDPALVLRGMNDVAAAEALIADRLAPAYAAAGFVPPFASWPFSRAAIAAAAAVNMMPRTILMRCDAFRRAAVETGRLSQCDSLVAPTEPPTPPAPRGDSGFDLDGARAAAVIEGLSTTDNDSAIGGLLHDVFDLYVRQLEPDEAVDVVSKGHAAQKIPPLHGRLTFTFHDQNDRERHICFRAIEHSHAISFQARLRAALTASGISARIADRHLLIVRRSPVPSGEKTRTLFDGFVKAGGQLIDPSDDDLRTFVALRSLRDTAIEAGRQDAFETWLRATRPLCGTALFNAAGLCPPPGPPSPGAGATPTPGTATSVDRGTSASNDRESWTSDRAPDPILPPADADAIPIGRRMTVAEEPVSLPIRLLPRHTAIIAGSGSGKTVLLRRIVEEAALAGIPGIVIDPNNDLSRLGDAWPHRPETFTAEDDAKARRYRDTVDVVVWTPGLHAGNPLVLSILPDVASLGDNRDERQQAVDMAADTLGPLAGARSATQRGVLAEAFRHFASRGGGDLAAFTALLADLPDGLSPISNAGKLAAGMADQLYAAVATNPLLIGAGPVLDPRRLFFGPDPRRTRVSVINLSGLASDAAREDFVNRLQMTLFGWIKQHPSPRGLLYVVDEAQSFLPAQKPARSLSSGIKLVAQARKYGLGLVLATQAPRGIHNQVLSNCTTQFFGRQSAPATISAAQEVIAASGGTAPDIGKLKAGEFYFATEGSVRPAKIRTRLCLTFHPANPPTPEDVIARARLTRDGV